MRFYLNREPLPIPFKISPCYSTERRAWIGLVKDPIFTDGSTNDFKISNGCLGGLCVRIIQHQSVMA